MRLLTKLNHELNKRILHADAIGGAFRFEYPINIKRDVLKNDCRHWLNLHVSIFGRYVINAKRFIKIMFGCWPVNCFIRHDNSGRCDLHSPAFGNRCAIDVVVLAPSSPDHKGNVIGFVSAEEVNGDAVQSTTHNVIRSAMENNTHKSKLFSDFGKLFFCGLTDVIKVFNRGLFSSVRTAKLKLNAVLGKDRGNDSLNRNNLISSESFTCGRDGGEINNLSTSPVFIGRKVHADNIKSFLSVPLIALTACLYDSHKSHPLWLINIINITCCQEKLSVVSV